MLWKYGAAISCGTALGFSSSFSLCYCDLVWWDKWWKSPVCRLLICTAMHIAWVAVYANANPAGHGFICRATIMLQISGPIRLVVSGSCTLKRIIIINRSPDLPFPQKARGSKGAPFSVIVYDFVLSLYWLFFLTTFNFQFRSLQLQIELFL